jgi:hypothetical protein
MLWRQVDQILAAFDTWIGENRSRKTATCLPSVGLDGTATDVHMV